MLSEPERRRSSADGAAGADAALRRRQLRGRRWVRRSARRSIRCKAGEAAAIQGVVGAAPPMRVVESVMDAQRSLQSVLAIRDKLVSAWQDISRMSI